MNGARPYVAVEVVRCAAMLAIALLALMAMMVPRVVSKLASVRVAKKQQGRKPSRDHRLRLDPALPSMDISSRVTHLPHWTAPRIMFSVRVTVNKVLNTYTRCMLHRTTRD
jgi:hypothetical protein